ncbi:MAG: hypothetical protein JOZ33_13500 [Acidobacteriaceae bacterium]|nr:hypothetical protein [Acidobacteriaceae bacterium]
MIAIVSPGLPAAQVFEVNGGSSSLYQAQGGTLTARGPSYDASVSGGVVAGKLVGGANLTKAVGNSTYLVGDDYVPFVLPTDIFDSSHYLVALGAGVKTNVRGADVFAFGGAISNSFNSPLFEGVRAESPVGILFLRKQIGPHLAATSNMVFSTQATAIEGLEWRPGKFLKAGLAAGVGANQPYGAASFDFTRSRIDIKAAYISAGSQFHRVALESPLMSEPDRGNVFVTVRPSRFFTVAAGRNNFLSPVGNTQTNVQSSVDSVFAGLQLAGTSLTASFYHSSYVRNSNDATAYTAERDLVSWAHVSASYLESWPTNGPRTSTFLSNVCEKITPRLNVTEFISQSHGQTTVAFGGGFLSNPISVTAQYQTFYVPERNSSPFEQALIMDVQLHLFHGVTLHGASFVAPDGSLRYTADTQAVAVRQGRSAPPGIGGQVNLVSASIGNALIRGTVLDTEERPIAGAALMIDELLVYTNDDGVYIVRERKAHTHRLKVLVDQFLNGDTYRVVSAPDTISSTSGNNGSETVIVVKRATGAGH